MVRFQQVSMGNFNSRVVLIGDIPLGGSNPIRIQSMTSTNTMDTKATVEQSIRMIDAGCEFVRITAQGIKEAEHLAVIKKELKKRGYNTPLIADIHFNPKAAEVAAGIVEKIRINPGNYIDRNRGKVDYSDAEYNEEINKIRIRIKPLINICKKYGTAIRIGSNHGSLSERILCRYGDTPEGMVESALEFVRICEDINFHSLVLSMKASNVKVMVQATRLLVNKMIEEGMNYPIHLGVTEAGDAEDGRIKSAAGIGPLLEDGIGDTIRVSLTEDPELEIPVAKIITGKFSQRKDRGSLIEDQNHIAINPFFYTRRKTRKVHNIGRSQVPVVIISSGNPAEDIHKFKGEIFPDFICDTKNSVVSDREQLSNKSEYPGNKIKFIHIKPGLKIEKISESIKQNQSAVIVIESEHDEPVRQIREMIFNLIKNEINNPVILKRKYANLSLEELQLTASSDFSFLLVDGLLDGIWLDAEGIDLKDICQIAFGILQATGSRISKTEYIACPSCGRTLFNIQDALQKIKAKTKHLKKLKIGVMGCIVNGPGEMADADYGYVGSGQGKITLYKRNRIVKKNVNENKAVDELINIIKADGNWIN